jgi:hypothetical protein
VPEKSIFWKVCFWPYHLQQVDNKANENPSFENVFEFTSKTTHYDTRIFMRLCKIEKSDY